MYNFVYLIHEQLSSLSSLDDAHQQKEIERFFLDEADIS